MSETSSQQFDPTVEPGRIALDDGRSIVVRHSVQAERVYSLVTTSRGGRATPFPSCSPAEARAFASALTAAADAVEAGQTEGSER